MAVIIPASVKSVVEQGLGSFCAERQHGSRTVRGWGGNSLLPERISSGKLCSSSGSRSISSGKKGRNPRVSNSSESEIARCSTVPGDGTSAGDARSPGRSSSSKTLRWVEEDVAVSSGAETGGRDVFVVQSVSEDIENSTVLNCATEMLTGLLQSDRNQPTSGVYCVDQLSMELMESNMIGNKVQTMSATMYRPKLFWFANSEVEENKYLDRTVNALLVGGAISYALAKAVTVDHDVWQGWTMFEILKYAPLHNWKAYEHMLQSNPILAKMMISGVVYSIGDWIGQCVEGKPILEFDRSRLLRSGLVGFCLHGSLSHHYYHVCEFLFPFQGWWVVPLKVAFDQTIWSAIWNSIYFITLGLLRFESPVRILKDLSATFLPLLTAGWKLWPFAHLVTYGLVPVEQRLLWVDCVEIIWVTILSMFSNEKAQKRLESGEGEAVLVLSDDVIIEETIFTKDP